MIANGSLDTFSIAWDGYSGSGILSRGDIDVPCEPSGAGGGGDDD